MKKAILLTAITIALSFSQALSYKGGAIIRNTTNYDIQDVSEYVSEKLGIEGDVIIMYLPKTFRLNGFIVYGATTSHDHETIYSSNKKRVHVIKLKAGMSEEQAKIIVCHELTHAWQYESGMKTDDGDVIVWKKVFMFNSNAPFSDSSPWEIEAEQIGRELVKMFYNDTNKWSKK